MKNTILPLLMICLSVTMSASDRWIHTAMSAVLPGSGELLTGHTNRGITLITADAVLWSFYIHSANDIRELQRSYKQYALQYAGVPLDRDNSYYQVIQNYFGSDDFNQFQELIARNYFILILNNHQAYQDYISNNTYTGEFAWQWENIQNWHHYKQMRRKHQITRMENQIFLGLLILNRLVSVIDVNLIHGRQKGHNSVYLSVPSSDQVMLNYQLRY